MSLEGKTAVITGAGRVIAAAVARSLHASGVNLALCSRSGDDLGLDRTVAHACDVRDAGARAGLCDATAERFGGIDIQVANAGVATDFALEEGRGRTLDAPPGMMSARDVAAAVLFVLERPPHLRILETALRPLTEGSWG